MIRDSLIRAVPFLVNGKKKSFSGKIQAEYDSYIRVIKTLSKEAIIERAEELTQYRNISHALITQPPDCVGLLICRSNLIHDIFQKIQGDENADFSMEYIESVISSFAAEIQKDTKLEAKLIEPYVVERENAASGTQAVVITLLETGEGNSTMTFPISSLYDYLEPSILKGFSEKFMLDFPTPNYFGTKNSELFYAIQKNRFCKCFQKHFKRFQTAGKNNGIIRIDKLIQTYTEAPLAGMQNRYTLAQFIKRNYEEPEEPMNRISEYYKQHSEILQGFQDMMGGL